MEDGPGCPVSVEGSVGTSSPGLGSGDGVSAGDGAPGKCEPGAILLTEAGIPRERESVGMWDWEGKWTIQQVLRTAEKCKGVLESTWPSLSQASCGIWASHFTPLNFSFLI